MELRILISFLCTREYDIQGSKVFVKLLYKSKCLQKQNIHLVHGTHTISSQDLVKIFEKGHDPLHRYFENQNFEQVVRVM